MALIRGGLGAEKEISYLTGKGFAEALEELGYPFETIDANKQLPVSLSESEGQVALLAVHGKYAEDGIVQSLCEYLKMPYTGSGVLSSALCMDKFFSKQFLKQQGICTPDSIMIHFQREKKELSPPPFDLPWIVKPRREGSSVGIHLVEKMDDFYPCLKKAAYYDPFVLVEKYIQGVEVAIPVWLGRPLTVIEIEPKTRFFDYKNKYTAGCTNYYLPARLKEEVLAYCQKVAVRSCESCQVRTYARVDLIVSQSGQPYVLEVNTLPGFTPISLFPKSAAYEGITFCELVKTLVEKASLDYTNYDK